MKATIDIKTPAGQSLEGFPLTCDSSGYICTEVWPNPDFVEVRCEHRFKSMPNIVQLHKGDKITIEVIE